MNNKTIKHGEKKTIDNKLPRMNKSWRLNGKNDKKGYNNENWRRLKEKQHSRNTEYERTNRKQQTKNG